MYVSIFEVSQSIIQKRALIKILITILQLHWRKNLMKVMNQMIKVSILNKL